ncbi:MAG: DUF362 domain-containing protein [Archaeoglobaceae archaeon]
MRSVNRREFLKWMGIISSFAFSGCIGREKVEEGLRNQSEEGTPMPDSSSNKRAGVYVIKTEDREKGVRELVSYFDRPLDRVAIKPNYNSADQFPAATHLSTLSAIVDNLRESTKDIVLAERSGMGNTASVLKDMGVMQLSEEKGFEVVVLDDLHSEDWVQKDVQGSHWENGFLFPKVFQEADSIVQTCCLKTHQFGGHFTMSLKNSVGMVAESNGHDYMSELHRSPHQRKMIAEINTAYEPDFVIMDGIKGFSKGGPASGTLIEPGVMLASSDRIALDAVGVATLRTYETTNNVSQGSVFQQDQIARAVELGLGVSSPENIELVPVNEEAQSYCDKVREKLLA